MKSTSYRGRSSDEALDEHLKLQRQQAMPMTMSTTRRQLSGSTVIAPTPPPPERMRMRTDSNATSIYVIGADTTGNYIGASGGGSARGAQTDSNPATMERRQHNRLSWVNMHRGGEDTPHLEGGDRGAVTITPSPQTTRSYISTVSTITATIGTGGDTIRSRAGGDGGVGVHIGNGTISGRNTAASGRMSTSGGTTISGSNNTLNDIISDYHSHEAASSNDFHYTSTVVASTPHVKNLSSNGSFNMTNGSTVKLLPVMDDESNQQVSEIIINFYKSI